MSFVVGCINPSAFALSVRIWSCLLRLVRFTRSSGSATLQTVTKITSQSVEHTPNARREGQDEQLHPTCLCSFRVEFNGITEYAASLSARKRHKQLFFGYVEIRGDSHVNILQHWKMHTLKHILVVLGTVGENLQILAGNSKDFHS
jgi:hypothetical protein